MKLRSIWRIRVQLRAVRTPGGIDCLGHAHAIGVVRLTVHTILPLAEGFTITVTSKTGILACRVLVRWIPLVRRRSLFVVVLSVLASIGALAYTVDQIGINASATDRLSEDLPFRRNSEQTNRAFPQLVDQIWIVVEADTPKRAEATGGWQAWVCS